MYLFDFAATKELLSPDGDSTTAPPSQSSEQSEVKNKVEFQLNPLQISSCSDAGSPPQTPSVKKIKKVRCTLDLEVKMIKSKTSNFFPQNAQENFSIFY